MITYRQATHDELNLAVEWAAREGWNPGHHDAEIFYDTDPDGFVCAEREGEIIATGSVVAYEKTFGFMGFFMVRPDLRGQGIGRDFWIWRRDLLRSRLAPGAAIGMDGVFDMQAFYSKGGFQFTHRNLRMEGIGQAFPPSNHTQPLQNIPFETVAAFDQKHFGFARENFLKQWIQPAGGCALGILRHEQLIGMGIIRPCLNGFKIGPLFAGEAATADQLFQDLSAFAKGQPLYLDIPENNPQACALAQRHQLKEVFGCARMYLGAPPELPWNRIFGITTFELG
ncbi:GNAT family N-acetyltransferase [Kiritimatiellaeota bacterium B1221]|nr:GNAT family N-acetyltransferase [Kiritimatiellaeota bacterium B1221]